MTTYFFDSSALAKRYVREIGTSWVLSTVALSTSHLVVIAQITSVEIVSALARQQRHSQITPRFVKASYLLLQRHIRREYAVLQLSPAVLSLAEKLLLNYTLRAYDAVQLASAIESNRRLISTGDPPLVFVSADQRLLLIAQQEGFQTDDPLQHP